jgi:23S rRNA (uracil1939-C5)-methyltransferase
VIDLNARLTIEKLGARGEGVARGPENSPIFVPYALPGEEVLAEVDDERGKLIEVLKASPDRVAAPCPHFGACGGCAVQTLGKPAYETWKRGLVVEALRLAGIAVEVAPLRAALSVEVAPLRAASSVEVAPLRAAWGAGRRRATFHARFDQRGGVRAGFMEARSHRIYPIDACPILAPEMAAAPAVAQELALCLKSLDKPLDLVVTGTNSGLDIDLRGCGKLDFALEQKLVAAAQRLDLARIANHGVIVIERRAPEISCGRASVSPPPGGFLQATAAGEEILTSLVGEALSGAKKCADLFSGSGAFALRLAEKAEVVCYESDAPALNAGLRAARACVGLRAVSGEVRDLFTRPLLPAELNQFDAVVFDPPRAGAEKQARELADSAVPRVAGVSCNPQTFGRDARILMGGGYELKSVTPVDQFLYSPHVELIGIFVKNAGKSVRKRRLLG